MLHYPSSGSLACIPLVYLTSTIFHLTTIHSWSWSWSLTFQVSMSLLGFLVLTAVPGKANNWGINIHRSNQFSLLMTLFNLIYMVQKGLVSHGNFSFCCLYMFVFHLLLCCSANILCTIVFKIRTEKAQDRERWKRHWCV